MADPSKLPILIHPTDEPSAFTAQTLIDDVRRLRQIPTDAPPPVCILEFDGDLTDWLVERGIARPFSSRACFHTTMFVLDLDGLVCGIIPRTIGGPYAVLIAEQLHASGTKLIIGLTSAGRVAPDSPLPGLVVATSAIRDEGTSYHYLPPAKEVACPSQITRSIERQLSTTGFAVPRGRYGRQTLLIERRMDSFKSGRARACSPWKCRLRRCLLLGRPGTSTWLLLRE